MNYLTNRQVLVVAIGLLIVGALIWSTNTSASPQMIETPAEGGTYIEGIVGQPKFINPVLSVPNSVDEDISSLVFNGLTKITDGGQVIGDLATHWEVSDDGKMYVFDIRPDARWQDGWPVTADDVVFTYKTIQNPAYQGNPAVAQLWQNVSVERLGDTRVKFSLHDAYAPFLESVSQGLIPAHLLSGVPPNKLGEDRFNMYPVGTGPFRVTESSLQAVGLEANPAYFGDKPFLSKIKFRFFADSKTALDALRKDEVQGMGYLSGEEAEAMKGDRRFNVYSSPEFSKLTLLLLNTKSDIFSDKVVRQAVSYGIDRQKLIDSVVSGQAAVADSPIFPVSWAYNRDAKKYDYNPKLAGALLDGAGWNEIDADGVRKKNGQRLSFILLTNDRPQRVAAAEEISRELLTIGIKVDVQAAGWSGFVQDFLVPRHFQAALAEQWSPNADPDIYQFWHSSQAKDDGLNFASWTNRQADDLLENARQSQDIAERTRLYRDFQTLFAEEQPGVLLYYSTFDYAVNKSIKGIHLDLMIEPSRRFAHLDEWYVRTQHVLADKKAGK